MFINHPVILITMIASVSAIVKLDDAVMSNYNLRDYLIMKQCI